MTVDIMLPFYGRMDHMHDAVRSVLAQTEPDWRLVVIDDAYPDDSLGSWLEAFGDPRIEYLRNETNVGVSGNFQRSVDLARSEHVVIMGCDDVMLPGFLAHMLGLLEIQPNAALVQAGTQIIDENGQPASTLVDSVKAALRPRAGRPRVLGGQRLASNLLHGDWMNFPAILWRRSALVDAGFDPRYAVVLDLEMTIRILMGGGVLILDDTVVFQYRRHASSVSSWRAAEGSRFREESEYFRHAAQILRKVGWHRAAFSASLHITSRLHALSKLPTAWRHHRGSVRILVNHAFGR